MSRLMEESGRAKWGRLKERTGSENGEEDKQTDETVNETLVHRRLRVVGPAVPLGNKTEEGAREERKQKGQRR